MQRRTVSQVVNELLRLYEVDCKRPFPYADSRKLMKEDSVRYDNLIAHLDLYFYEIASHCGGVKKIVGWPVERLLESQKRLRESFFARHPEYKLLEPSISESNTPELHTTLLRHERMRKELVDLLSMLLAERV